MSAPVASRPFLPFLALGILAALPARAEEPGLQEKLLDNKYRHGDYAVYFAWHDPQDWQFDEHGSHAMPVGFKIRFRWLEWLRVEGDFSYFRTGDDPPILLSIYKAPEFDGLLVGGFVQAQLRKTGFLRPYVGAGPVFASLGNDFLVFRPDVRDVAPDDPNQFALASWSRFDLGWMASGGVDFNFGRRWAPFVEYRHLFGELTLDDDDVRIGSFPFPVEELHTLPPDVESDGVPHSRKYDWSGPFVTAGLRIRF